MASTAITGQAGRKKVAMHDGFLKHAGFRWLKISSAIMLSSLAKAMLTSRRATMAAAGMAIRSARLARC